MNFSLKINNIGAVCCGMLVFVCSLYASAESVMAPGRISDVINTKHNFAAEQEPDLPPNMARTVKASSQNETCVFCHTPHGDPNKVALPFLWNRSFSQQTYNLYASDSLNATLSQPGPSSKMCLSCHDGTLAMGAVNVVNGRLTSDVGEIAMVNSLSASSNLGSNLSNDHPLGFSYSSDIANADGELQDPNTVPYIGTRVGQGVARWNTAGTQIGAAPDNAPIKAATRFSVPLESSLSSAIGSDKTTFATTVTTGLVECTTCHDPHIRSTDNARNIKFLRLRRFQAVDPSGGIEFNKDNDINCLACHKKAGWRDSVHAKESVANLEYNDDAAQQRDFPLGLKVWEAGCLNCHDAHTSEGSRWLLNAGVNNSGESASEETCYRCHSQSGNVLTASANLGDIRMEFAKEGAMPISDSPEVHTIINGDFEEVMNVNQRHVECSDCHHPHRMVKKQLFNQDASFADAQGTHVHEAGVVHSNLISGVLRGISGVEPNYGATGVITNYTVKKGDPGVNPSTDVTEEYVTREYQICFKCHSDNAIDIFPKTLPNAHIINTNTASEFHPIDDVTGNNHRSWHPVVGATGRSTADTSIDAATYVAPFDQALGTQTMYCSDCHAGENSNTGGMKGPHGSNHQSILIGSWDQDTGLGRSSDLCFQCHQYDQYANPTTTDVAKSGFSCSACTTDVSQTNLHLVHAQAEADGSAIKCGLCHVKIPHGWKNKALLIDLATKAVEDNAYYFDNASLSLISGMKPSGQWARADCTGSGCHTAQ